MLLTIEPSLKQTKIPVLRKESVYLQLTAVGKGKTYFLQWSIAGYMNHNPGQALCPGGAGQNKMLFGVLFFLTGFLFHLFLFLF